MASYTNWYLYRNGYHKEHRYFLFILLDEPYCCCNKLVTILSLSWLQNCNLFWAADMSNYILITRQLGPTRAGNYSIKTKIAKVQLLSPGMKSPHHCHHHEACCWTNVENIQKGGIHLWNKWPDDHHSIGWTRTNV